MSARGRLVALALVVAFVVAGTGWYLVQAREDAVRPPRESAPGLAVTALDSLGEAPRIVFRSTAPDSGYGRVAVVALDDPGGPRGFDDLTCDRVAAAPGTTVCLRAVPGVTSAYVAEVRRDGRSTEVRRPGVPSRARVSPDSRWWASTSFVAGDSYASAGFSTRTFVTSADGGPGLHVEDFTLRHEGRVVRPVDRNFWGVTFADDDTFYVTASFGGTPWLARGSLERRTVTTLGVTGECPSLSPDGRLLAHKLRRDDGGWSIHVLDLRTGEQRELPGERSVDDQVAWLDDETVLYGLPRTGADSGQSDVWAVPADGSAAPRLLVEQASSPTVVR